MKMGDRGQGTGDGSFPDVCAPGRPATAGRYDFSSAARARSARARCERAFFSSGGISA